MPAIKPAETLRLLDHLLTLEEAAERLGCSGKTLRQLVRSEGFPPGIAFPSENGRTVRVIWAALVRYLGEGVAPQQERAPQSPQTYRYQTPDVEVEITVRDKARAEGKEV